MRILLFGGTFNPVHWGHLVLAEELREEFSYDLVLFVPSARPPHKQVSVSDPGPEERLAMLRLAVSGNPGLAVDDCELHREGPSYTVDTLKYFLSHYEVEGRPGLVIGDDLAPGFASWREPETIASMADIIIARRGGEGTAFPYRHLNARNRLIPISSSEIRERLMSGLSVRYLVPEAVLDYIRKGGLYGPAS